MQIGESLRKHAKNKLEQFFYTDRCNIHRQVPIIDDYGSDDYKFIVVATDVICHLSKKNTDGEIRITMQDSTVDINYRLHVGNEQDIQANDVVEVFRNGEKVGTYNAGKVFEYPTFKQIHLVAREWAKSG